MTIGRCAQGAWLSSVNVMNTSATAHTLRPPTDPRWPAVVRVVVAILAFCSVLILLVPGFAVLLDLLGLPELAVQIMGSFFFAAAVVGLVVGLARLERRPGSVRQLFGQFALRWSRHDAISLLVAVLASAVGILLIGVVGRLAGFTVPTDALSQLTTAQFIGGVAYGLVPAFVMQAFPEELFYRGYVLNAVRVRVPVAVAISSLTFGSLHVLSSSPATGVLERFVLYPLMATCLGFACALARLATGSLWAAIGIHGGMHVGHQFAGLFSGPDLYVLELVAEIVVFLAIGLLFWAGRRRLGRRDETVDPVAECSTVAA